MNNQTQDSQWSIDWRGRGNRAQRLAFELDHGNSYLVVVHSEEDKGRFLDLMLRPPETAVVSPDGGLLNNLRIDENLLLPVSYHGLVTEAAEKTIAELFAEGGLNEKETRDLLVKLPSELSLYQRRLAGFVRSALMNPRVMIYDSIWVGVSKAEIGQIRRFDSLYRYYSPAHTAIYLDYDTHLDNEIHAKETFIL